MEDLPNEILEVIFFNLDGIDLCNVSMVCKRWNCVASNENLWKNACMRSKIKEEPELASYGTFGNESGLWKTYYRLYINRCRNWKNNKYVLLEKGGQSWFYQGWSSYQDLCLLPSYTDNTVDVFRITPEKLLLDHQIMLPVPGVEPTFLYTGMRSIAAAKSNITLIYNKDENGYHLIKIFAFKPDAVVKFDGNPQDAVSVSYFVSQHYVRCGLLKVVEHKSNIIWLCDSTNLKLWLVKYDKCGLERWFHIHCHSLFRSGSGYVCFTTNKSLQICTLEGEIYYVIKEVGIDSISFNEQFIALKLSSQKVVKTWNLKKKEKLASVQCASNTSLVVHGDSVYLFQLQSSCLSCCDVRTGVVRWETNYEIPDPPKVPQFYYKLSIILNKFLIIFPSHTYGQQSKTFALLDIVTGEIYYKSQYTGMIVEVSDRLLVTIIPRKTYTAYIENGNYVLIRCYI